MKSEKSRVATDTKRKCSHPGERQSQTSRRAERSAKNAHVARSLFRPSIILETAAGLACSFHVSDNTARVRLNYQFY
jgi:hypothetical protein